MTITLSQMEAKRPAILEKGLVMARSMPISVCFMANSTSAYWDEVLLLPYFSNAVLNLCSHQPEITDIYRCL